MHEREMEDILLWIKFYSHSKKLTNHHISILQVGVEALSNRNFSKRKLNKEVRLTYLYLSISPFFRETKFRGLGNQDWEVQKLKYLKHKA